MKYSLFASTQPRNFIAFGASPTIKLWLEENDKTVSLL